MITLEHVSKTFDTSAGDVHAVKDVNLQIEAQEIYGI
ncbi:MAG: methionine ABC transporter ATP-binding protein, partial [Erysipelotrichaceae bacterium]